MLQHISSQQAFNNDRTAYMAAFRHPAHPSVLHPATLQSGGPVAPTLATSTPQPVINDPEAVQAQATLNNVRQEMHSQGASALTQAHSGLDAERVARLLGVLE